MKVPVSGYFSNNSRSIIRIMRSSSQNISARVVRLAPTLRSAFRKEARIARTVILKLKTNDLNILTRSHTPISPPASCEEKTAIALALRERVELRLKQLFASSASTLAIFTTPKMHCCSQACSIDQRYSLNGALHVEAVRRIWVLILRKLGHQHPNLSSERNRDGISSKSFC